MIRKILLFAVASIAICAPAACAQSIYFISSNGSDSNSGTSSSTPWQHVPGTALCSAVCASIGEPQDNDDFVILPDDLQFCYQFYNPSPPLSSCGYTWSGLQSLDSLYLHNVYATASITSAGTITLLRAPFDSRLRIRILSIMLAEGNSANIVTFGFSANQRVYNVWANDTALERDATQTNGDLNFDGDAGDALSVTTTSAGPLNITVRYVIEDPNSPYTF